MSISDVVGVLSALIALIALGVAASTFRRGAELQAFLVLTERYERIMAELPHEARTATEWDPELDPGDMIRLRYLNLCSEEFYLHKRGLLSRRVWQVWEGEIRVTLSTPPYVDAWHRLRDQFQSYPAFIRFVDLAQS
jgi:hypothetical protein